MARVDLGIRIDDATDDFLQFVDASIAIAKPQIGGAPVTVPASALAMASFDRDGHLLAGDERFGRWLDAAEVAHAVEDWLRGDREPRLAVVSAADGATTVVLLGRASDADGWALPGGLRQDLEGCAAVAIAYRPFEDRELGERACRSWRLTPVEARTVLGLISAGDLIEGARRAGTGYETARKALKLAMRKAGAQRQTDLVRLLHAAVGGGDLQLSQAPGLGHALGLTVRCAGAAVLLALGLTRAEAAATLRIGEHTLKDDLKVLFERFRLRSSTDLSRLVTEAAVLLGLPINPNLAIAGSWSALRPLRFVSRRGEAGRIALSDFGPASGEPTLLFHSATTGCLLDRGLVRALHRRGLRPIAIERPGFGLTDAPERGRQDTALNDVLTVIDAFGLKRVRIIARGGEGVALELARRHPALVARGVLINPFTPYSLDSRWDGFLNQAKRTFVKHPDLIEPVATFLVQRASPKVIERLTRQSLNGSAPDMALLRNRDAVEDYVESARLCGLRTTWGFVHEQREFLTWRPPQLDDASNWVRIVGEHDVLYQSRDSDALWTSVLPGHQCLRVPDGGRFVHASHPDLVAEAVGS
ncbi:alpha/beta hydrolase [uncultured Phenylobacterium sp.]|uniref:alpha/beta fold hydrolase n=1 Tax=uncultured Phenylobacterium sp. TaxID=349273 RepID=UPI0025F7939E|nr:alpha/beta hydrolase [uncultured Phenylobacterium sp.]